VSESPVDPFDPKTLPAHACAYCGIHDVNTVVRCVAKDCGKWFCNGKGLNEYGSHAVFHLVRSKHKEIQLHPDSPLGGTQLECLSCSGRNIFLLGFVCAKQESCVMILCREPCRTQLRDSKWDTENWQPLIENKTLLSWLVQFPSHLDFRRSFKLST